MKKYLKDKTIVLLLVVISILLGLNIYSIAGRFRHSPVPVDIPENAQEDEAIAPEAEEASVPTFEHGIFMITELMPNNKAAFQTDAGIYADWVELVNTSEAAASLSGCVISSDKGRWSAPDIELGPGEYVVLHSGNLTALDGSGDFSMPSDGYISVTEPSGDSCRVEYSDIKADCSYALDANDVFLLTDYFTPGFSNDSDSFITVQSNMPASGPLFISEIVSANITDFRIGNENDYPDWIELYNASDSDIDLSEYYLSDDADNLKKWQLPDKTLEQGKYYVVLCTTKITEYKDYDIAPFGIDSGHEDVYLSTDDGVLDIVHTRGAPAGGSIGRVLSQNGLFYFPKATPGSDNVNGGRYICSAPVSDSEDGIFSGSQSVILTLEGKGDIYYTTDGSLPDTSSTLYTQPIEISSTCTVRAICADGIGLNSRALTKNYIINEEHSLPVVSICADAPKDLEDIYKKGIDYVELPGNISYYDPDGSFSLDCGLKMSGGATLQNEYKKNISVKFRSSYGESKLEYDLFGSEITEFSDLVLRGGQDSRRAIIRNELAQELALQCLSNMFTQHSKYVVLYVNGNYYGIYALKERICAQTISDYNGLKKDSITIYNFPAVEGEEFYENIVKPCTTYAVADPDVYHDVCEKIDIDSLIDWFILEGYTGNVDILYNNVRFYRSSSAQSDGKWHAIFFDLDAGFRYPEFYYKNLLYQDYEKNQILHIFRGLMSSSEFRSAFLTRLGELLRGPLSNSNVLEEIDYLYDLIESEVNRDLKRWKQSVSNFEREKKIVRSFVYENDYAAKIISRFTTVFSLSDEEVRQYFYP